MRTRLIFFIVAVLSLTISPISLTSNAAPNPIEIISIAEVSCTSVEILFDSSISKKALSYYLISATGDGSVVMPKNIKKVIKTKATGLITAELKNLNPKATYNFSVSAKTNKAKMISSKVVKYSSVCNLLDMLSNLPADWGNPKPIQLPTPAPTTAPVALPAFTLSSATETRTVNTAATGFTINSTGGAIASFAINATPSNMSFNTTSGALTGTPNTVAAATNYTITATNASGSATQTFGLTVTAVVYTIGQTGPGGGTVFYVATTPFSCGPTLATTCTYLEAASTTATTNPWTDAKYEWSGNTSVEIGANAQGPAIGTGYANTLAIVGQSGGGNTVARAGTISRAYRGPNNLMDWFLPSKDELNQMCKWQRGITGEALTNLITVCTGGTKNSGSGAAGFVDAPAPYWSSSETTKNTATAQNFDNGDQSNVAGKNGTNIFVRPVRAF